MNRSTLKMAAVALLSAASHSVFAQVDFKGIPLGSPKESLLAKYPSLQCSKLGGSFAVLGEEHCTDDQQSVRTYAGLPVWDATFGFADGRLGQFTLTAHSRNYSAIRDSLIEAYGRGQETVRPVQTTGGATFNSRSWELVRRDGSSISVFEHAVSVDEAGVVGRSSAFASWQKDRASRDAKAGSKDL